MRQGESVQNGQSHEALALFCRIPNDLTHGNFERQNGA